MSENTLLHTISMHGATSRAKKTVLEKRYLLKKLYLRNSIVICIYGENHATQSLHFLDIKREVRWRSEEPVLS